MADKLLDLNLYSTQLESSFQRKSSLAALESYTYNIDRSQIIPYQVKLRNLTYLVTIRSIL